MGGVRNRIEERKRTNCIHLLRGRGCLLWGPGHSCLCRIRVNTFMIRTFPRCLPLPCKQNPKTDVSIVPEHRDWSNDHKLGSCLVPVLSIISIQFYAQNALVCIINDEDILIKISLRECDLYWLKCCGIVSCICCGRLL